MLPYAIILSGHKKEDYLFEKCIGCDNPQLNQPRNKKYAYNLIRICFINAYHFILISSGFLFLLQSKQKIADFQKIQISKMVAVFCCFVLQVVVETTVKL